MPRSGGTGPSPRYTLLSPAPTSPWHYSYQRPLRAKLNESSHCLEDVISTVEKTHESLPDSAPIINEYDDPVINKNDSKIVVIMSKDGHGINFADTKVNEPNQPDLVSSHQKNPRSTQPPNTSGLPSLLTFLDASPTAY